MSGQYNLLDMNEIEKFIVNYKAVYQAMTAKHDCKSKIFPRSIKVKKEDIHELNDRVTEKLKNYNDAGFSTYVTASFTGRQTIEFSSWAEFEAHNWNESNAITSLTIIWEFNAILPHFEIPQKHVLVVKIADGLRPEEMLNIVFAGKLENIDDIEKQMYPVVARVDFINYVLGDELLHLVETWNNGLEVQYVEDNAFFKFIKKHKRKLAFAINYFTNFIVLFCCLKIFVFSLEQYGAKKLADLSINNICDLVWLAGFLTVFFIFTSKFSEWFANIFYRTLFEEKELHVFDLNKGDHNIQQIINQKYKKNKLFTIGSVLGTFLINLFCTIICSFIVNR
ncbi:MAG: hypothetical protein HFH49_04260 [Lachnospiraceae bacterium]|nr:hypothetical protein [Lachnospiraceae bacterium]